MPFERRFRPHPGVVPFLGAGFFLRRLFCVGLCFTLACAIVMLIDLWSGLSVTLSVADAQMIGAIYGVKQSRSVLFPPATGGGVASGCGFSFSGCVRFRLRAARGRSGVFCLP